MTLFTPQRLQAAFSPAGGRAGCSSGVSPADVDVVPVTADSIRTVLEKMENSFPDRVEHKSRQVNKTTEAVGDDDVRPSQQLGKNVEKMLMVPPSVGMKSICILIIFLLAKC